MTTSHRPAQHAPYLRELLAQRHPEGIVQTLLTAAHDLTTADQVSLTLLDRSTGRLTRQTVPIPADPFCQRHFHDHSLTRQIISSLQAITVSDVPADPRCDPEFIRSGVQTFTGLPIPGNTEEPCGVLYVYSRQAHSFDSPEVQILLRQLAEQTGLAIENARVYAEMDAHARYLEALVTAGNGLTRAHTFPEALDGVATFIREQFRVSTFFIGIYDRSRDELSYPWAMDRGVSLVIPPRKLGPDPASWGVSGMVVQTGQELFWSSLEEGEQILSKQGIQIQYNGDPPEPQTCFYLPLKNAGGYAGVISIQSLQPHAFSPLLMDACRALASQFSVSMENIRLFETAQNVTRQLSALNRVTLEIASERSRPALLRQIIRQAIRLLSAEGGGVYLLAPTEDIFTLQVAEGLPVEMEGQHTRVDEGINALIYHSGAPQKVNEYSQWEQRQHLLDGVRISGVAGAPIRVDDQFIGTLVVHDLDEGRTFDDKDLALLQQFANHAGLALQKADLFNKLESLQQISTTITSSLDLTEVLNRTCQAAVELFGVDHSGLVLFEPSLDWGRVRGSYPPMPDFSDQRIPIRGIPIEERLVFQGEPLVIEDVEDSASELGAVAEIFRSQRIRALLLVPIRYQGRILGSFSLDSFDRPRKFTVEEINICHAFADQVAVAIENAQLFAENLSGRESLRSFYAASNALVSSHDLKKVLHDIVGGARQTSRASGVTLIMMDGDGQPMAFIPAGTDAPIRLRNFIRQNGLSMHVLRSGKPEIVEDTERETERINPSMRKRGIRSAICVPVVLKGERIGVMWFHFVEVHHFSHAEIEAAQFYVNQAALAYDSARRIKEQEYLRRAAESLAGADSLEEVLRQIVLSACKVLDANSAAIWSYDDVRDRFIPDQSVSSGIDLDIWQEFLHNGMHLGQTAEAVIKNGWVGVTNTSDEERFSFMGSATRVDLKKIGVRSFQGIALRVGEDVLGVLYVNYNQRHTFGQEERKIARTFANHAALALKNARLLEQVSIARDAARVVAKLSTLEDLNQTLESIALASQNTLSCDAVTLYTYDAIKDTFGFPPAMAGVLDINPVLLLGKVTEKSVVRNILDLDHMHVTENAQTDPVMSGRFVEREGILSSVGIPLAVGDQKVGVMFVNYRSIHHFTPDEITNLELFSNQAAVAIRNAQLFQMEQHDKHALFAIQETSSAVSGILQLDVLLPMITQRAAEIFEVPATSLMLWDDNNESLMIYASHGLSDSYREQQRISRKQVTKLAQNHGIHAQVIDLSLNPVGNRALVEEEGLSTVLTAPLKTPDALLGMLNIYSKSNPHTFDEKDLELANIFANHAAIAIKNAKDYAELRRSKGLVGARTALAWMGMVSGEWMHTIKKKTITLREEVQRLRQQLEHGNPDPEKLEARLNRMERLANQISAVPITSPLSGVEGVHTLQLDDVVQERLDQLWKDEPYHSVILEYEFTLGGAGSVRTSAEWLCKALDILVDNGVEATRHREHRELYVSTALNGSRAEVLIRDNGHGIPPNKLLHLFREPMPKRKDETGMGMGLLMARTIMQAYNGDVDLLETDSSGTTMVLWLPVEA